MRQIVSASLQPDFLSQPVRSYLGATSCLALFMSQDASVYEIESLFSTKRDDDQYVEVVRIT